MQICSRASASDASAARKTAPVEIGGGTSEIETIIGARELPNIILNKRAVISLCNIQRRSSARTFQSGFLGQNGGRPRSNINARYVPGTGLLEI